MLNVEVALDNNHYYYMLLCKWLECSSSSEVCIYINESAKRKFKDTLFQKNMNNVHHFRPILINVRSTMRNFSLTVRIVAS